MIGGGVNGAGIARDLAGRGLKVALCEKDDLASATSSASTKLIHGGLRYLEHYEFRLVHEALAEREVLLRSAPHIIWPMTFVLPHHRNLRPRWLIRLGLFIYDHLGGHMTLPSSKAHFLPGTLLGQPLKTTFKRGFTYADCWVEDSRLVVLNALDAFEKGAVVMLRTECTGLVPHPKDSGWVATLQNNLTDEKFRIGAELVVNASGPWVDKTLGFADKTLGKHHVRKVKGSHIIVPRLYQGDHAYILQQDDKRVVFAIPYERKFTLIGTTDVEYKGDIEEVRIDIEEVEYLCSAVNRYFRQQLKPEDVLWTYSGVRPLLDDGAGDVSSVTRDYVLEMDVCEGASILSVYGGKLTTFRRLAEQAGNMVVAALKKGGKPWTKTAALPGGEGAAAHFQTFLKTLKREYNWLPEALAWRLARAYGARARNMLRGFKRLSDMGEYMGDGVYEVEIKYLVETEWAMTMDDILWRRSKLGLHTSDETQRKIARLLKKLLTKNEDAA